MFSQLSFYIFSALILLIFTFTSVYSVTCDVYHKTCHYDPFDSWCCQNYETCGSYYGSCYGATTSTPSIDIPVALLSVIIIVPLFICVICLSCCIRQQQQQRLHSPIYNANGEVVAYPYQQQPVRGGARVIQVRPVYNVSAAPTIHSIYEESPPSYEDATANLPPKYSSEPPSVPVIATVEETNSRV